MLSGLSKWAQFKTLKPGYLSLFGNIEQGRPVLLYNVLVQKVRAIFFNGASPHYSDGRSNAENDAKQIHECAQNSVWVQPWNKKQTGTPVVLLRNRSAMRKLTDERIRLSYRSESAYYNAT